jgi:hypothetical protein
LIKIDFFNQVIVLNMSFQIQKDLIAKYCELASSQGMLEISIEPLVNMFGGIMIDIACEMGLTFHSTRQYVIVLATTPAAEF